MSAVPSGTRIFAITPSSIASYSMVALSVSISARMSPALTLSPSFLSHLARLPFSMVGDSAGIRMLIGIGPPHGFDGSCPRLLTGASIAATRIVICSSERPWDGPPPRPPLAVADRLRRRDDFSDRRQRKLFQV